MYFGVGVDVAGQCKGGLEGGGPTVSDEVVGRCFVVFLAAEGVISVSIVCDATRTMGRVGRVIYWESEFAL